MENTNRSYKDIVWFLLGLLKIRLMFLIDFNIPVYTDDNQGYYETLEIKYF